MKSLLIVQAHICLTSFFLFADDVSFEQSLKKNDIIAVKKIVHNHKNMINTRIPETTNYAGTFFTSYKTPLYMAAEYARTEIFKILIDEGANPNALSTIIEYTRQSGEGWLREYTTTLHAPPLYALIRSQNIQNIEYLLQKTKASVNMIVQSTTERCLWSANSDNPNCFSPTEQSQSLLSIALASNKKIAQYLIEHKALVDQTSLLIMEEQKIVQELLVNAPREVIASAINAAIDSKSYDTLSFLLKTKNALITNDMIESAKKNNLNAQSITDLKNRVKKQ